ncbi:MAG: PAS domain-containing protein, partial [Vicinamibacterales bacterium]
MQADIDPALAPRFDTLVAASPAVIYTASCAPPYGAKFVTANIKDQLGYEPAAFLADPDFWISRVHPDDLPVVANLIARNAS